MVSAHQQNLISSLVLALLLLTLTSCASETIKASSNESTSWAKSAITSEKNANEQSSMVTLEKKDEVTTSKKGMTTSKKQIASESTTMSQADVSTTQDRNRPQNIRPGLYVENGVIKLNGEKFYGIGVNYYELATARYSNLLDAGPAQSIKNIAGYRIPYVRTKFSAWGTEGMSLFWNDRETYWRIMDDAVTLAEQYHIGIIATVAWTMNPYLENGTTAGQLLINRSSENYQRMLFYIESVMTRYRNSPAIWGWEIGNEYNLAADLTDLSTDILTQFYTDLTPRMAAWDGYGRLILHGHSQNRASAWNLAQNGSWTADTMPQMREMLHKYLTPEMGGTSIHVYNRTQTLGGQTVSLSEYLKMLAGWCKEFEKPLFIGEYCDDEIAYPLTDTNANRAISLKKFKEMHEAIIANDIQLAVQWMQNNSMDVYRKPDSYYVTMLEAAKEANVGFVAAGKQNTKEYWSKTHNVFYQW